MSGRIADGGEPSGLWKKMALMRKLQERFQALQDEEEIDNQKNGGDDADISVHPTESGRSSPRVEAPKPQEVSKATTRWTKIRRIVMSDKLNRLRGNISKNATPMVSPRAGASEDGEQTPFGQSRANSGKTGNVLEMEDIRLDSFWDDEKLLESYHIDGDVSTEVNRPPEKERVFEGFEEEIVPQALVVSRIPEAVVNEKKTAIEKATIEKHKVALDNVKTLQTDVIWREDLARRRVKEMEKKARQNLFIEKNKIVDTALEKEKEMSVQFRKAREDLESGIRRQVGAVKEHFGSILVHRDSVARKFNVFTKMFPQPIEMRIHMLRGVKNKLPKGAYALMLTQYESLGGHPVSWSNLDACGIGSGRPGITRVVKHPGRYFDRIMRFEDSVFALCPPQPVLRPSFVFVLELFQLASHKNPVDKIVAWTALPMSFENMSLVEGKLRLPMLRGEHSPVFQHFRTMEQTIANDLNNWLCNIYLEVRHLSLQELGATEAMLKSADYDLDYVNKSVVSGKDLPKVLLSYEEAYQKSVFATHHKSTVGYSKVATNEDTSGEIDSPRAEAAHAALIPQLPVDKGIFRRKLHTHAASEEKGDLEMGGGQKGGRTNTDEEKKSVLHEQVSIFQQIGRLWQRGGSSSVHPVTSPFRSNSRLSSGDSFADHRTAVLRKWKQNVRLKLKKLDDEDGDVKDDIDVLERGYSLQDEEFLHPEQRGKLAGVESIDDPKARSWAAAGLEGTVVRRWQVEGPRLDGDSIANGALSPKSPKSPGTGGSSMFFASSLKLAEADDTNGKEGWVELRDGRELTEYTMSIAYDPTRSKNLMPGAIARSKLRYIYLELFGDLFPIHYGTFDFYVTIFCYVFALWMRIYVHYVSQYLYILGIGTPLYSFSLRVLEISFKYSSSSISDANEVAIVAIGSIGNLLLMLLFTVFGYGFYKYSGFLPDGFSKFFAAYGFTVMLDPYLILIIDLIYHNYDCGGHIHACQVSYTSSDCNCFNGDFIKLANRLKRTEGSGITGAFITIILFFCSTVLGAFILYEYLVYIHRDGRILDLWRRITSPPSTFFVPDDLEVSRDELMHALQKARRWIGPAGARRKVVIQEGVEKDPEHKNYLARFTRYIVNEVEKDGTTAVHRQFVLDHEGKIVEVFEDHKVKMQRQNVFAVFHKNEGGANPEGTVAATGSDHRDDAADIQSRGSRHQDDSHSDEDDGNHRPKGTNSRQGSHNPMLSGGNQGDNHSRRGSHSSSESKAHSHRSSSATDFVPPASSTSQRGAGDVLFEQQSSVRTYLH